MRSIALVLSLASLSAGQNARDAGGLQQPCEPFPACRNLVDGNTSTSISDGSGTAQLSLRGTGHPTASRRFKVYLDGEQNVYGIVIICDLSGNEADETEIADLAQRAVTLKVWLGKAAFQSSARMSKPSQLVRSDDDHHSLLRLEFFFDEALAHAVEVESDSGLCGRRPIAEVSMLRRTASASARRQSARLAMRLPRPASEEGLPDLEEEGPMVVEKEVVVPQSADDSSITSEGFLAPRSEAGASRFATRADVILLMGMGVLVLAMASILSGTCLSLPWKMMSHGSTPYVSSWPTRTPFAETGQAPSTSNGTAYFWIGGDELSEVADSEAQVEPNSAIVEPAATESEPEAELYPESGCSTPRLSTPSLAAANLELSGVTFREVAERPLPPAWPAPAPPTAKPISTPPGRLLMLYASPLCRLDPSRGPVPLPQLSFEQEWQEVLLRPYEEAMSNMQHRPKPLANLSARLLTAGSLQRALATTSSGASCSVLHISAHGVDGGLILEDGRATAHLFTCDLLRGLLALGRASPRLVVLNACSSLNLGRCFTESGVPHVICTSSEVRDCWSRLFFRAFYASIFGGSSIGAAFAAATMAFRCEPSIGDAAAAFSLLPEVDVHSEVLFPGKVARPLSSWKLRGMFPTLAGTDCEEDDSSDESQVEKRTSRLPRETRPQLSSLTQSWAPFQQRLPELPEDFIGRSLDVWSVLQHLEHRRLLVLCNAESDAPGMGKAAVLDAVHRSAAYHLGSRCVAVDFTRPECEALGRRQWLLELMEAVRRVLQEETQRGRPCLGGLREAEIAASRNCLRKFRRPRGRNCVQGGRQEAAKELDKAEEESYQELLQALSQELCRLAGHWRQQSNSPTAVVSIGSGTDSDRRGRLHGRPFNTGGRLSGGPQCGGSISGGVGGPGGILLLLRGCNHLVQQQHVQESLVELLRLCPACRIVLSSRSRMIGASGHFKVVHYELRGLEPGDSARLFLSRLQRPLTWGELDPTVRPHLASIIGAREANSLVTLHGSHRAEVLALIAAQPALSALNGRPGALIELASQVKPGLRSIKDLAPNE